VCFGALLSWPSNTGAIQQSKKPDESLTLAADLVLVDAQVISKKTRLAVAGLGKDDFEVYEDGVKQYILYFSQEKLPLSMVILLDVSSSIAPYFDALRAAATQSLKRLKPTDEVGVMTFGGTARVLQPLTQDRQLLSDAILAADATGLQNGTDVNEGLYQAASYLQHTSRRESRRAILAITDDVTQSVRTPRSESTTYQKLSESDSTVCGVIFFNPIKNSLLNRGAGVRTYASATGGIVVDAEKKKLEANLTAVVEHLRTRYTVGYAPSNTKHDGSFRKIKLDLSASAAERAGKLEIIARKGYHAVGRGI
jgi:VWFA-related protein